jgi:hypothetical protein
MGRVILGQVWDAIKNRSGIAARTVPYDLGTYMGRSKLVNLRLRALHRPLAYRDTV